MSARTAALVQEQMTPKSSQRDSLSRRGEEKPDALVRTAMRLTHSSHDAGDLVAGTVPRASTLVN
ncbi:MAG: hypothetical protein LJE84_00025 [Gammaproteobacteria bacterium]|nr:hypothetical protein [Gammaproteobacteria bacterium]